MLYSLPLQLTHPNFTETDRLANKARISGESLLVTLILVLILNFSVLYFRLIVFTSIPYMLSLFIIKEFWIFSNAVCDSIEMIPWRRAWQPTPVFSPGKSHGQRSLVGYSPWGRKESDTTEQLSTHTHIIS